MIHNHTGVSLLTRLRGFNADQAGVSAVEFAVLLPLMLTLYLGGVEISQAVSADRKTTLVAHTVGDLTAQVSNVTSGGDIPNIFDAATKVAYPYPVANLKATVSSVCIDATGQIATIGWSRPNANATARSGTVTSFIPKALMVPNTSLIWGEATYAYKPTIGWTITGTLNLSDQFFMRPRQSCSVTLDLQHGCC
ncbi:MAG TPA: TadE/TadG family type IV pilus assembly protein [Xanthobacteraceae bacterium]|jgi:Flp pilus assembly protein TadG